MQTDERSTDMRSMAALVRHGAVDEMLVALRPVVIEPSPDAHPALWRQSWIAWQELRGFGSDLISPPDHYRPNPYWSPPQIRLWAYNRAALLLSECAASPDGDVPFERRDEANLLLRFLGVPERRDHVP